MKNYFSTFPSESSYSAGVGVSFKGSSVTDECHLHVEMHGTILKGVWLGEGSSNAKVNCAVGVQCLALIMPVLCVLSLSPGEESAVWQCLTLLEEGLSHSPSNAQFKLLLIRIYCRLGAFEPVAELYSSLDAKHIQHDTIGWVVFTENNW